MGDYRLLAPLAAFMTLVSFADIGDAERMLIDANVTAAKCGDGTVFAVCRRRLR